ncbi:endo-1,4-beta-xylanase B [Ruminiclostridium hungatei]|uniref:Beta-xylanase n=1 Tax=Ruminiclostridium hungatei TaxID=48256 RepID=A0A1V4SMN9_RUMHU|nr:endo-1,4-beta-xylanase [Ruminiclostridium hungatei]OPX45152.1 endo-1,4-beta-xylanase B [Ruminiclostridium hungatei]
MSHSCDAVYKHRLGTKRLKLVGTDGNPLGNTEVVIKQKKHEFLFGCGEFNSIAYANNELDENGRLKAEDKYKKLFDLFNFVTLPFYWGDFENIKGRPHTQRLKKTAQWLISRGCAVKGHCLCWHSYSAPWLLDMSNSQILSAQLQRIRRESRDFAGLIDIWDLINEVVIMPIYDRYDNGITRICKDVGRIRLVREVFAAAKEANPDAVFLINDFFNTTTDSYDVLIEACLEAGIPIGAIGIQSHMHKGYWGVEKTLKILERFSTFNLPVHFTESTVLSGHHMPQETDDFNDYVPEKWLSTPEGEEQQARETILHYKTLFAHPAVESITWWEFADGQWLGAPSGLLTCENRVKPAYEELHKLIKGKWWTGPEAAISDETGLIEFSGFRGEYELNCHGKKYSFILDKKGGETEIVV